MGGREAYGGVMARLLLIVSRTEPARFTYFKHVFGGEPADVIIDRRVEERRQRRESSGSRETPRGPAPTGYHQGSSDEWLGTGEGLGNAAFKGTRHVL
jgi:hypothetical protein